MKHPNLVYNNLIKKIASLCYEAEKEIEESKELASLQKESVN